jgi:ABC-type iron transport system FetAB ATPase subunit
MLLRAIADLDDHRGLVRLDGVAAVDMPAHQWRRHVGLLPPESVWWLPRAGDHFHDELPVPLAHIGLEHDILARPVTRLSSGEKQRLALMRLLANRPEVLLLDEPTANLDPDNTRRIEDVIAEYRHEHGAVVIWVTHDREQVARVADRYCCVEAGTLVERDIEGRQWLS